MSDWNTHLYCANIVNESLRLEGRDLNLFLFGNLLPDVNMGWIIHPEVVMHQKDTHFDEVGQDYFWAPLRFYQKYEAEVKAKNPLFLGYLFHLWLDVSFMTDFMSRIPMSDMISRHYEVRERKWKDCGLFIRDYHYTLPSEYIPDVYEEAKKIEEVQISEDDLKKVVDYLDNNLTEFEGDAYIVYKPSELKQFYDSVIKDFVTWVENPGK